jgi:hypothetical protein
MATIQVAVINASTVLQGHLRAAVQHNGATGHRDASRRFDSDLETVGMGDCHRHHERGVPDRIDLKHRGRQRLLASDCPQLVRLPHGQRRQKMYDHESALLGGAPYDPAGCRRGGKLGTGQGGDPSVGMCDKGGEHALLHQLLRELMVHHPLLPQLYLRVVQGQPQDADEACDSHSPCL